MRSPTQEYAEPADPAFGTHSSRAAWAARTGAHQRAVAGTANRWGTCEIPKFRPVCHARPATPQASQCPKPRTSLGPLAQSGGGTSFARGRPAGHNMHPSSVSRGVHASHGATRDPVTGAPTSSTPPDAPIKEPPPEPRPPKLLDQVRLACRLRHLSDRTEEAYVGWIRRFILFHNKRHPAAMAAPEIASFLDR